ncbi:hypothetical protein A2U01_0105172, partial [Trifolium medium]|nr:hypothetical protein [Trifolium medium]
MHLRNARLQPAQRAINRSHLMQTLQQPRNAPSLLAQRATTRAKLLHFHHLAQRA